MTQWRHIGWDIEANGFKPTEIFCIGATDLLSMEKKMFFGDDIAEGCYMLSQAETLVGHYIRGYDCPVIERLTDGMIKFNPDTIVDTLDMSKKLTNNQKHSLEFWGNKFGLPKLASPLFESFTPKMLPYCARDVEITVKLFYHLLEIYLENGCKKTFRNHEGLAPFLAAL